MTSIYEKQNDNFFLGFYKVSYITVVLVGIIGIMVTLFALDLNINFGIFADVIDDMASIIQLLLLLSLSAIIVGIIQVVFTSLLGEEIILITIWISPFLVIATSFYMFLDNNDVNMLGGAAAGLIFLGAIIYFRKAVRMSARLIEVGGEITMRNLSMMRPQLTAYVLTTLITLLMFPGVIVIFSLGANINIFLAIILAFVYEIMYFFVVGGIRAFADAINIAYVNQWYSGKPSSSKARTQVNAQRSAILKYAFIMAFVAKFRSKKQGSTPLSLFKWMKFSDWPKLIMRGRSVKSTAADVVVYFGNFTLVVMMVKKTKSVTAAYKESAKSVFKNFASNIAGSMGFNIIEGLRQFISSVLLLAIGGIYAYNKYDDIIVVIIMAIIFMLLGMTPLNSMFKPVVNTFRLLLYRSYTGSVSSKLDKKTRKIIKSAMKK